MGVSNRLFPLKPPEPLEYYMIIPYEKSQFSFDYQTQQKVSPEIAKLREEGALLAATDSIQIVSL